MNFYKNKNILVTGGAGSIGSEIVKKILEYNPHLIRVLDVNETGLFDLEQKLKSNKLRLLVCDIRDKDRLRRAVEGVDIIFHAGALKHVPLCEYNPIDAIGVNVMGTQNLIDVAIDEEVEKFVTISTDKAVNPINIMGTTKALAEKLTILANFYQGSRRVAFCCVRFGNVLYSRGSVIPLFTQQIKENCGLTVTDVNMTRFVMSMENAIDLILKSAEISCGGEIFISKMNAFCLGDLVDVMIRKIAPTYCHKPDEIKITPIGKRAGEKMHESLMTESESETAYECNSSFIIYPSPSILHLIMDEVTIPEGFKKVKKGKYTSETAKLLSKEEIGELIRD